MLGSLVVPDFRLAELARALPGGERLRVCAVNTSGAGGLVSLAKRQLPGVDIVAIESVLRDLDDLPGSAARMVAAAGELDDSVDVYVEVPDAPRWEAAVAEVEAAGLKAAIRMDAQSNWARVAEQLSALIEADLPFKAVGGRWSVLPLAVAVHALVEDATAAEAAALLNQTPADLAPRVRDWTEVTVARVRRRLWRVHAWSIADVAAELTAAGLVRPA